MVDWAAWDRDARKAQAIMAEDAWKHGDTYLYQEPEPLYRWPIPTRRACWRAKIKLWYRRRRIWLAGKIAP